jgi:hypothetical protein
MSEDLTLEHMSKKSIQGHYKKALDETIAKQLSDLKEM